MIRNFVCLAMRGRAGFRLAGHAGSHSRLAGASGVVYLPVKGFVTLRP
jgi:hypothetical protein